MREYNISPGDADELLQELYAVGYYRIVDLPKFFFDVYFDFEFEKIADRDVLLAYEIADVMERIEFPVDDLWYALYLAAERDIDPIDLIKNYEQYTSWDEEEE